jgi:hypothetical protein
LFSQALIAPHLRFLFHFSFQLHDNALALHHYTREEKKKAHNGQGDGFDGELDNFQEPELSSIVRLDMEDTLQL